MDALSRGPLVYCLESVDNPLDLFSVKVNRKSLKPVYDESLLGGIWKILGETTRWQAADLHSLHVVGQPRPVTDECILQ